MTLTEYLNNRGFTWFEGNSQDVKQQVHDLIMLTNNPNLNVMEIGFNAGHSADVFLKNNPTLTLTSFDIGLHNYILAAKEYIDDTYPNRHKLIIGNSMKTIPNYLKNNEHIKFDIIFIDGNHDYEIAKKDMENCFRLAHKDTIVILDDTVYVKEWVKGWNDGPTKVWNEFLKQNKIVELGKASYKEGRGMSWGKYVL